MIDRARRAYGFASEFIGLTADRNIGLISAGVAFFALLAVFPGIAAFISLFGMIADPIALQQQLALIEDLVPPAAFALLNNQITRLVWSNDGTLGWAGAVSTLIALFLARRGVDAMLRGVNAVHGQARRNGLHHALAVAVITLGMLLAGIVALLALLILPVLLAVFPLAGAQAQIVELGRWAISFSMVALWLWVFYRIGPVRTNNRRPRVLPGLLLALTLWIAASAGFSYFLSNFGRYNEVYGSLGAVVALLMWFYLSVYVVMLGGVLNTMLEARHTETQADRGQTG